MFVNILLLSLHRIHANLFIVLLEGCEILPGLGELSLLHALPHIPVDEGPLGVHQIKLVVQSGPGLGDGGGVGQHADGSLDLRKVSSRDHGGRLIVDSNLNIFQSNTGRKLRM